MARRILFAGLTTGLILVSPPGVAKASAQVLPLAPDRESGLSVTPAFEGWYRNPDGTFSLSFGYLNRNTREVLEIPVGPANFFAPGDSNQGQPTRFEARRHWGVFAVTVPADFGTEEVIWTVSLRGETYAIPGALKRGWEIDAIGGEGASGNFPPIMRFEPGGITAQGPGGRYAAPLTAQVGAPLELTVWVSDPPSRPQAPTRAASTGAARGGATGAAAATGRGAAAGAAAATGRAGRGGRGGAAASLMWFKHQGPGEVTFVPSAPRPDNANEGKATASVTFSEPGVYILRLRATEGAVASAGHAQCCWSNGFVKVTVSR